MNFAEFSEKVDLSIAELIFLGLPIVIDNVDIVDQIKSRLCLNISEIIWT